MTIDAFGDEESDLSSLSEGQNERVKRGKASAPKKGRRRANRRKVKVPPTSLGPEESEDPAGQAEEAEASEPAPFTKYEGGTLGQLFHAQS